ncbi:MAG: TonB-dependent receptor plug domain-containing protein [Gammaproteobacteria bacterium]
MVTSPHHPTAKGATSKVTAAGLLLIAGIVAAPALHAQEALEEHCRHGPEGDREHPGRTALRRGTDWRGHGQVRCQPGRRTRGLRAEFAMSETGIGTNLYVRGIGSGINQGFEQSVGLYIDDVYYGRAQLTRAPFMDTAQAEALRGPQAILLGNNSIAGALNFTTAKPTGLFHLHGQRTVRTGPQRTGDQRHGLRAAG